MHSESTTSKKLSRKWCIHFGVCTYTHVYIHNIHTYMYICAYIHTFIHTGRRHQRSFQENGSSGKATHTHICTYIYTHTYIYIRMHPCTLKTTLFLHSKYAYVYHACRNKPCIQSMEIRARAYAHKHEGL